MYAAKETENVAKPIQKIKVKEEKEKKKNKEKNLVVLSYIALGPFFFLYTIIMAIQNTCMIKIFLACL